MAQLDGFVMLGFTQGYKYTGKPFIYCPWCGKQIKDVDNPPDEGSVIIRSDSNDDTKYTATMKTK